MHNKTKKFIIIIVHKLLGIKLYYTCDIQLASFVVAK